MGEHFANLVNPTPQAGISAAQRSIAPTYATDIQGNIPEVMTNTAMPIFLPDRTIEQPDTVPQPSSADPTFKQDTPSVTPKVQRPSYAQASRDQYGNPRLGNGQTRLGNLLTILTTGLQGAAAGAGAKTFGEGFQRAQQAPFQRAAMVNQQKEDELQNQQRQAQIDNIPFVRKQQQLQQDLTAAQIAKLNAEAGAKDNPADKMIKDYVGADGKQHLVFLRPDNSTYDKAIGDVNQPDPKANLTPAGMWHDAFVRDNGREPNVQEIAAYDKQHAQNIHINTNSVPPGTDVPLIDPKKQPNMFKIAQDMAYGKLTMQAFRSIYAYSRDANAKQSLYATAANLNPNFNPAAFEMGYTLAKNPKVQQQLASLDNVMQNIPHLIEVSDNATRSGVPLINKLVLKTGLNLGGKRYSNFHTAQIAFADELSGALGYGSATDMSREMGFNMTREDLSPSAFSEALTNIVAPFVQKKRSTLLNQMGIYGEPGMNPAANAPQTPDEVNKPKPNGSRPPLSSFEH